MRGLFALAFWLATVGAASAGPLGFDFSTSPAQEGEYRFTGRTFADQHLIPGSANLVSVFDLIGDYSRPMMVAPIDLYGPTLTTHFTLTDRGSGQSGSFDIPIYFYDNEPTPDGEMDGHIPGMNAFEARRFDLGDTRYTVFGSPQLLHIVGEQISGAPTPEPTTLILVATALALPAARRARRLFA